MRRSLETSEPGRLHLGRRPHGFSRVSNLRLNSSTISSDLFFSGADFSLAIASYGRAWMFWPAIPIGKLQSRFLSSKGCATQFKETLISEVFPILRYIQRTRHTCRHLSSFHVQRVAV